MKEMAGKVFSRLTVQHKDGKDRHGNITWACLCECGNNATVSGALLRNGATKSCGCLRLELLRAERPHRRGINCHNYKGGQTVVGSEANLNRRLRGGKQSAADKGHEPVLISGERLAQLYKEHDQHCDICGTPEVELDHKLHIDHCHDTGEFRGWLCKSCNTAIGLLRESTHLLWRATLYLERR